jgi:hypothetical protein
MPTLPPKQRAALLGLYGQSLVGSPAYPDELGIKAATWRAVVRKGLAATHPSDADTLVLTRAGRSALRLRKRRYKTALGALRAALRTIVPWPIEPRALHTGARIPGLTIDADDWRDDPVCVTGSPDLFAALPVGEPAITGVEDELELEPGALLGWADWADRVGLEEEDASIHVWQAVSEWMEELGHPVDIVERQGWNLFHRA